MSCVDYIEDMRKASLKKQFKSMKMRVSALQRISPVKQILIEDELGAKSDHETDAESSEVRAT